jgi:hypothetical protein
MFQQQRPVFPQGLADPARWRQQPTLRPRQLNPDLPDSEQRQQEEPRQQPALAEFAKALG